MKMSCTIFDISGELFIIHCLFLLNYKWIPDYIKIVGIDGCAGGRIGTMFLRPRGTSPLKVVNPVGTPGYRNWTESFFGLKGRPSVVWDV